jgi:hypothetical protein
MVTKPADSFSGEPEQCGIEMLGFVVSFLSTRANSAHLFRFRNPKKRF